MLRLMTRNGLILLMVMLAGAASRAQTNPTPLLYPLPSSATAPGGPAFSLTVNGTGFVSGAVVNWNGSPRPTTFVSSSQAIAAVTAADIAIPKTAVITVTNPGPGGGTSNSQHFQVTFPTDPAAGLTFQDTQLPSDLLTDRVLVGDFNGDGKPDLVELQYVMNPETSLLNKYVIKILLGNGDGTFQAPATVFDAPDGNLVVDLVAADVNGDGKLDLIGSHEVGMPAGFGGFAGYSGTFTLLGNGDGTFQPPVESDNDTTLNTLATRTVVGDLNGDGIPDLVRACRTGVCVELGNGDGTFRNLFNYAVSNPIASQYAGAVALGDFRKTGKLDIIAAYQPFSLVLLPNNGDGTFGPASVVATVDSLELDDITVGDFDHDGNLDLEVYYHNLPLLDFSTAAAMSLLRGNGDGTFQPPLTLPGLSQNFRESAGGVRTILLPGDFNGDGNVDLAVWNLLVLIGNATGLLNHNSVSLTTSAVAEGDFNGDGRLDLVGIDSNFSVHLLTQTSVPDFVGSIVDPPFQDVRPGGTGTYTIDVTSLNGFAGTIQFSASGLPKGATATFTPSTLVGSGTVTVTISTMRHTPKGSYEILVSGTSVGITHSGGIILNVVRNDETAEDFGGTVSPGFQTVVPGASTTYQINIVPINGFDSDVRLKVHGLPPGATATFVPEVVENGSGSSVLTVTTVNPTTTGTYHLTITGRGGRRRHDDGVNLNAGPAGTDFTDYIGSVTPAVQTVSVGGSTSFTAAIQPINGTGCVYLQVSGLPAATNGHFDRSTPICGSPASAMFTITTSSLTPTGTYLLTFVGNTTGGFAHASTVTLIVTP